MALNSLGLGFVFRAKDFASPVLRKVEGNFKRLDATTAASAASIKRNLVTMGAGFAVAATGAIGLGAAAASADAFGKFEEQIAIVGARANATAEEMDRLSKKAMESSLITQFSPREAAEGLEQFAAQGFNVRQQIDALNPALDLAAGGMISVKQSASTVAAALKVFSLDASGSELAAGQLLRITNLTALSANELRVALGNVSRGAGTAAATMEQMLPAIGVVRNTGVEASMAGTAVSSAFDFMAKNSEKIKKRFGVDVADAAGNFRDFNMISMEIMQKGRERFGGTTEVAKELVEVMGKFGKTAVVALGNQYAKGIETAEGKTLKGAAAIQYLEEQMRSAAKAAEEQRERMLDTFEGQKKLLSGTLKGLKVELGEAFAAGLRPIVTGLRKAIVGLIQVLQSMPKPLKKILGGIFILGSAALVAAGSVIMLGAAVGLAKAAFAAFSGPILLVGAVFAKVAIAGLLLGAVFGTIAKAWKLNIGGLADGAGETLSKFKLFFSAIGQLLSGDGNIRGEAAEGLLDPMNKGVLNMVRMFEQVRFRVAAFFDGLKFGFHSVIEASEPTFRALKAAFKDFAKALGFGDSAFKKLGISSGRFSDAGMDVGQIIGFIAKLLINALTIGLRVATGAIEGFKAGWVVVGPVIKFVGIVLFTMLRVLNLVLQALGITVESTVEANGAFGGLGGIVGWVAGMFLAFKAAAIVLAKVGLGALILKLGIVQRLIYAVAMSGMSLGAMLPIVGAAAAGLALGTAIDSWLGWSDAIAGVNNNLRMTEAELNKIGQTKKRGANFDTVAAAAKEQGLSVDKYLDKRSAEVAKESTAQRLGLSQAEIRRRIEHGENVFKEVVGPARKPSAEGVVAMQDGQITHAGVVGASTEESMYRAMVKAGMTKKAARKQAKLAVNIQIGDEDVSGAIDTAALAKDAAAFEALMQGTGTF